MSLRKSTCLTPQRLDAARSNAQHSTGPRSQPGKERMKMNASKHGCDAAPQNEAAVMRALGEDPARYAALKRDLAAAYGPGDALWDQQVEDLTKLYWRRNRLERMQTGLMRRALEALEAHYQELWTVLEEEMAEVEKEFQHQVEAQEEREAMERDACLAPEGRTREILLREEMALDRSIDRKVKIILTMRKEHARSLREPVARTPATGVRGSCKEKPQTANPAVCATLPDAGTESQAEERPAESSKSPEQSQNVIENKGPDAAGVLA